MFKEKKLHNIVIIDYFCKYCKTKGSSMDTEKTQCPNCSKELKIYRRNI